MDIRYNENDLRQSRFRERREDLDLSLTEFAKVVGLDKSTLSLYEDMKRRDPETVTLIHNMLQLMGSPERTQIISEIHGRWV
jgi:transcriptional regulator with XRE-family HTH domain